MLALPEALDPAEQLHHKAVGRGSKSVRYLITEVSGSSHMISCLNSPQVIAAHLTGMSLPDKADDLG